MTSILSKEWRLNNLYQIIDRDGQSIPFQLNHIQEGTIKQVHNRTLILKARQLGMCLDPNTLVLKENLSWIKIKDIEAGTKIIGIDEEPTQMGSTRKLRSGIVEAVKWTREEAFLITFEEGGTLTCSGGHRWLARTKSKEYKWRSINGDGLKLKVGQKIRKAFDYSSFNKGWEGNPCPTPPSGICGTIRSIEPLGLRDLIDLQTDIKTFIAEGYVSHNSTFAVIYILDEALFNPHLNCGIVSYSIEHAQHIFKKIIGHALDCMPKQFRPCTGIIQRSAKEITFNNKSSLRVDTTLRGGAYQAILVSEFGKTCARYPIHAEEVVTGTLNAVSKKGKIIIESTAEGNEGYFADMCMEAIQRKEGKLSELDYHIIFWAWHHEKSYVLEEHVEKPVELVDYFKMLQEKHNISLSEEQKNWYASYYRLLGEKVRQEYPSTVEESFLVKSDAYFFSEGLELANKEERLLYNTIYDPVLPVFVAMDIGINHATVIIYFQIHHGEVRIIDYYSDTNKDAQFYAQHLLQEKRYFYQKIFIPHDVRKRSNVDLSTSWEKEFRSFFNHTEIKIIVLPKLDKKLQISHGRNILRRCVFFMKKCSGLVKHLMKYRKKWSEHLGVYVDEPFDDKHADYADAFCYMARGVTHIEASGKLSEGLKLHREMKSSKKRLV